ncbi:MAG: ABC transporter permease [Phycisphaerales bacterium]
MKISLVFIVILLILLAFIPSVLNEEQPLRYRVQQWMQYGAGFGYMILALMTVFFCAASVAFEQRDKIIWQTATKPVPAWAYIGGKWVGVMILNAILLLVVSGGVFLFTKYLELQPAQGEVAYHRVVDQSVEGGIRNTSIMEDGRDSRTLDRRLLEDQVLVARVGREPLLEVIDDERLEQAVERRLAQMKSNDPSVEINEDLRSALRQDLRREAETLRRAVRSAKPEFSRSPVSRNSLAAISTSPSGTRSRPARTIRRLCTASGFASTASSGRRPWASVSRRVFVRSA